MNKKNLRKGFTTVELVIVIAVIAILATALIPTFSGLIDSANNTAAMNEARQIYNDYLLKNATKGDAADLWISTAEGELFYKVIDGQLDTKNPVKKGNTALAASPDTDDTINTAVITIKADKNADSGFVCTGTHSDSDSDKLCDICGATVSGS